VRFRIFGLFVLGHRSICSCSTRSIGIFLFSFINLIFRFGILLLFILFLDQSYFFFEITSYSSVLPFLWLYFCPMQSIYFSICLFIQLIKYSFVSKIHTFVSKNNHFLEVLSSMFNFHDKEFNKFY
jgi:hypothetical protein